MLDQVRRSIKLNAELLEQQWVRHLFIEFCWWLHRQWPAPSLARRINAYAVFFEGIDRRHAALTDITLESLFDAFGAEKLRRSFRIIQYLGEKGIVSWNSDRLETLIEMRRANSIVQGNSSSESARVLQKYQSHLGQSGAAPLKQRTIRLYLCTASNFLTHSGCLPPTQLRQSHLDRYLRHTPGQAANLTPFVRFLGEQYSVDLAVPKKRTKPAPPVERRLIGALKRDIARLRETTDPAEGRALLLEIVALSYQIPRTHLLTLTAQDVRIVDNHVVLASKRGQVQLAQELTPFFIKYVDLTREPVLFQGRNGLQPLSYTAMRYYLLKPDRIADATAQVD